MNNPYIQRMQQQIVAQNINNPQVLKQLAFMLEAEQPGSNASKHPIWIVKETWEDDATDGAYESENIHVFDNFILLKRALTNLISNEDGWREEKPQHEADMIVAQVQSFLEQDRISAVTDLINSMDTDYKINIYQSELNQIIS